MKQSKPPVLIAHLNHTDVGYRLDYLTNILGYDAASSKKLVAQKEKHR
jgi:hypothetical protein